MERKQIMKILIEFNFSNSIQDIIETEEIDRNNPELDIYLFNLYSEYQSRGANKYRSVIAYYDAETGDLNYMNKGTWIHYNGDLESDL